MAKIKFWAIDVPHASISADDPCSVIGDNQNYTAYDDIRTWIAEGNAAQDWHNNYYTIEFVGMPYKRAQRVAEKYVRGATAVDDAYSAIDIEDKYVQLSRKRWKFNKAALTPQQLSDLNTNKYLVLSWDKMTVNNYFIDKQGEDNFFSRDSIRFTLDGNPVHAIRRNKYALFIEPSELLHQDPLEEMPLVWSSFNNSASTALGKVPETVVGVGPVNAGGEHVYESSDRSGPPPNREDYVVWQNMCNAIRTLGIKAGYNPKQKAYADKAISLTDHLLLNPATRTLPIGSSLNSGKPIRTTHPIELYILVPRLLHGLSFIAPYWEKTNPAQFSNFLQWVSDFLTSIDSNVESDNRWNWLIACRASCAAFTENQVVLDDCYNRHVDVVFSGGPAPGRRILDGPTYFLNNDYRRTGSFGGLAYSGYALVAMLLTCMIAKYRGQNIYDQDNAIQNSIDAHLGYLNGTVVWPYSQDNMQVALDEWLGAIAIANQLWPKQEYRDMLQFISTPSHRVLGPVHLIYGGD